MVGKGSVLYICVLIKHLRVISIVKMTLSGPNAILSCDIYSDFHKLTTDVT